MFQCLGDFVTYLNMRILILRYIRIIQLWQWACYVHFTNLIESLNFKTHVGWLKNCIKSVMCKKVPSAVFPFVSRTSMFNYGYIYGCISVLSAIAILKILLRFVTACRHKRKVDQEQYFRFLNFPFHGINDDIDN